MVALCCALADLASGVGLIWDCKQGFNSTEGMNGINVPTDEMVVWLLELVEFTLQMTSMPQERHCIAAAAEKE